MVGNTLLTNPEETTGEMTDWPIEWCMEQEMNDAWAIDERPTQGLQFTPKVAPSFDGRISWFAFEEAIDDWLEITTLTPERWAPSLKSRLAGDASIYKPLLDRDRLKDPNDGLEYFKNELRPHFVTGVEAVFIFRFYQLQRFYRGTEDLHRRIGRLQVLRKRIIDAWTDTFLPDPPEHGDFLAALNADKDQLQADGLAMQRQAVAAGFPPAPIVLFTIEEGLERWRTTRKEERTEISFH